ncbi:MAG: EAL domain-containing protein [Betaproteobacteria bacterium]|nr:EAL domain-containing protein [Betaproteobacteria bacterium]
MITGARAVGAVAALFGLLLAAALAADLRATQQTLQRQLEARNRDAAAVLAAALMQQGREPSAWRAVAAAQFAAGHTRNLRLQAIGRSEMVVDLQRQAALTAAPGWLLRALPLAAAPARLVLGEGGTAVGRLELETDPSWAQDALWDSFKRTGFAAAVLGAVSLLAGAWAWVGRRPKSGRMATAATARFEGTSAGSPSVDTGTAAHWREAYATQAEQVAHLQRQTQLDSGTGLTLRHHFLAQLQQRLDEPGGQGLALLIVRVLDLEATNLRLGHESTDRLLGAVANVLLTYVDRVPATLAGRLNGTDFALCLPVAGVAAETAESLRTALAATPALRAGHTEVAVGGVDGLRDTGAGAALAAADAALARAEAEGDTAIGCVVLQASTQGEVLGARAWRELIRAALVEGRTQLAEIPLCDRLGQLLHLDCALRLQLRHGDAFEPADCWRAAARRSRLLPQIDLVAIERALEGIAGDAHARAVQISRSSLATPGFTSDVAAGLAGAPAAARLLVLELIDDVRAGTGAGAAPVTAALSVWGRLGVRAGVALGAGATAELPDLKAAGVQYVKLDGGQAQGLAHDEAVRVYVRGLVTLVHDLGLTLTVSGVHDAEDAQALWALGVDGASAPTVPQVQMTG